MKIAIAIVLLMLLAATVGVVAGCGGEEDPTDLLKRCEQAVNDYIQDGGYLHFKQGTEYSLETTQGVFNQKLDIEGDSIFPDSQSYAFQETLSSSKIPEEPQSNSFSYLTLDRGKTAYVKGEQLSAQLGVSGWIYYTPPQDQNRYFDLLKFMETIAGVESDVERVGKEDVEGASCVHLTYVLQGQKVLDLRLREDPALTEKLQGFDINELLRDFQVDIWVGENDFLPRRVLMSQGLDLESGIRSHSDYGIDLYGWGEESPVVIERPASYTEAL